MTLKQLVRASKGDDVESGIKARIRLLEHSAQVLPDVVTFLQSMDNPEHVTAKGSKVLRKIIRLAEQVDVPVKRKQPTSKYWPVSKHSGMDTGG